MVSPIYFQFILILYNLNISKAKIMKVSKVQDFGNFQLSPICMDFTLSWTL